MNKKRSGLVLLLALTMIVSMLPVMVSANEPIILIRGATLITNPEATAGVENATRKALLSAKTLNMQVTAVNLFFTKANFQITITNKNDKPDTFAKRTVTKQLIFEIPAKGNFTSGQLDILTDQISHVLADRALTYIAN